MKKLLTALSILAIGSSLANAQYSLSGLNSDTSKYGGIDAGSLTYSDAAALQGSYVLEGGSYDIVFLGEDAAYKWSDLYFLGNDNPGGTEVGTTDVAQLKVFNDIQQGVNIEVGNYNTLTVGDDGLGDIEKFLFDFLLDSSQNTGQGGSGQYRLLYTAYTLPTAGTANGHVSYGDNLLIFAFEDLENPEVFGDAEPDYNDLYFAINLGANAVPEPSTYGIIGALALLALVATRRMKQNKA